MKKLSCVLTLVLTLALTPAALAGEAAPAPNALADRAWAVLEDFGSWLLGLFQPSTGSSQAGPSTGPGDPDDPDDPLVGPGGDGGDGSSNPSLGADVPPGG